MLLFKIYELYEHYVKIYVMLSGDSFNIVLFLWLFIAAMLLFIIKIKLHVSV